MTRHNRASGGRILSSDTRPTRRHGAGRQALAQAAFGLAAAVLSGGCTPPAQRIFVAAQRADGVSETLTEQFDEAWYSTDARNQWDFVLRRARPGKADPAHDIEQTLHIRLFWKPVPGATYADSSQTDAVIQYLISSGPSAICYEGAGFLYFSRRIGSDDVSARIESASLTPARRIGEPAEPFGKCLLTGEFRARLNRGRTAELIRELNLRIGSKPAAASR